MYVVGNPINNTDIDLLKRKDSLDGKKKRMTRTSRKFLALNSKVTCFFFAS